MEQFGPINQNTQYRSLLGSLAIQTAEKTTVDHPSNLARTKSKSDNNAIPESPTTQRLRLYQLQKGNSQSVIVSRPGALAREGSRSGHAHARTSSFEKGFLEYVKGIEGITSPKTIASQGSFRGFHSPENSNDLGSDRLSINVSARSSAHVLPEVTPISPIELMKSTSQIPDVSETSSAPAIAHPIQSNNQA